MKLAAPSSKAAQIEDREALMAFLDPNFSLKTSMEGRINSLLDVGKKSDKINQLSHKLDTTVNQKLKQNQSALALISKGRNQKNSVFNNGPEQHKVSFMALDKRQSDSHNQPRYVNDSFNQTQSTMGGSRGKMAQILNTNYGRFNDADPIKINDQTSKSLAKLNTQKDFYSYAHSKNLIGQSMNNSKLETSEVSTSPDSKLGASGMS